jgi:hypothetical protein
MLRSAILVVVLTLLVALLVGQPLRSNKPGPDSPLQSPPLAGEETSFRILLGMTDTKSTPWNGSLSVSRGSITRLEPWRFDEDDVLSGESTWALSTHPMRVFGPQAPRPVVANGVVATFRNLIVESEVRVETVQGTFSFRPADLPFGTVGRFLDERVAVDRVPASTQVTSSRDEQDYPAAATDGQGNLWVAYLQFTRNPKFAGIRMAVKQPITNYAELAEPSNGDQVFLVRYSRGTWSQPMPVSRDHGDLYKPAVAVDGSGRVWVFWSSNTGGNFDLYARAFEANAGGRELHLTSDPGPDVNPVAATDAQGRVWVAWQAFRRGLSQIHAMRQSGAAFGPEVQVAAPAANEWNPAIASSPRGDIAVAWDSYRNGNYDVYVRTFDSEGRPETERQVAATPRYEAYPSLAYDPAGRLWVAWEESGENWGKDWGAYETTGIALYQGRWIRAKVLEGERAFTVGDPETLLPGTPDRYIDSRERQGQPWRTPQPDANLFRQRSPNQVPQPPPRPKNSYPRLLGDHGGRIWLAYRTAQPNWFGPLGTVWFENVVSFDGAGWSNRIFLPHSDNLLDNRPALASTGGGELLVVHSSEGRQQVDAELRKADAPGQAFQQMERDPYNNDLFFSRIVVPDPVKPVNLEPAPPEPSPSRKVQSPNVRLLRDYRTTLNGTEYRLLRGEFHRHTEISMDGGNDGSLWDAWRYALDAAELDWIGCCDHDNGFGRESTWWTTQKLTDMFLLPGVFTPMFSHERSVPYPEGHRNVVFAQRGVRTLPRRLPRASEEDTGPAPDTQMLYGYLRHFDGIAASHTSGTNMGTDWRNNDPQVETTVEIYQGDRQNYERPDAPRSNNANDSIGGWREKGFVSLALEKGYRLAFEASSDHISTHISYCMLYTTAPTRSAVLEAFKKRRLYAATDNILADVRSGEHMMGEQFETAEPPTLNVKLTGTAPFARIVVVKNNRYVYSTEPHAPAVQFTWRDTEAEAGKTSYYYVRGEQEDGEIVWASPMWISYRGR